MDPTLRIEVSQVKEKGQLDLKGLLATEALDPFSAEARLLGPVAVELRAFWQEGNVGLEGRAGGDWELQCCRCLKKVPARFGVALDALIEEPGTVIEGLEEVRQTLLLAVPTQTYCRPDCRGLCPSCGADRNEKDCGCVIAPPSRFKITKRGKPDA
jgi:uncharacterized metal-binding protein YceD (DUF177 family)